MTTWLTRVVSAIKARSDEAVPQSEPIPGAEERMSRNSSGGLSFAVDDWARLDRFLILGSEGGSYYATERELTVDNLEAVRRCLRFDPRRTIERIVEISDSGRAPKNRPAIRALAVAAADPKLTAMVADAYPKVCRIPTDQFEFLERVKGSRGWGRGLRKMAARVYENKSAEDLAYHLVKYQTRTVTSDAERSSRKAAPNASPSSWSHRDVLRLCHPKIDDPAKNAALRWAVGGIDALGERTVQRDGKAIVYPDLRAQLPKIIEGAERIKSAQTGDEAARLVRDYGLPRECVPSDRLNDRAVWEALLETMPLMAMIRSLGKMTAVGLLQTDSQAERTVVARLRDADRLRRSRLHPLAILIAGCVYAQGRGVKGSLSWAPSPSVKNALDDAFYAAFGNVQATNRPTVIAMDVSGSMSMGQVAGTFLTPREAAAAMALVTSRIEPDCRIMAFAHDLVPVDIQSDDRLPDVIRKTSMLPFGGTDCALPMLRALERKWSVDSFVVLTDSETWFGQVHPTQALRSYRDASGRPAKLAVVGMVANDFSIADPNDAGMLDVVGFDSAAPQLIADFCR